MSLIAAKAGVAACALSLCSALGSPPSSFHPMTLCSKYTPAEIATGDHEMTLLPRMRRGRLEVLTARGSSGCHPGARLHPPHELVIADAADNSLISEQVIDEASTAGVPREPVERVRSTTWDMERVFSDMDQMLPYFAHGRQPAEPSVIATRERLRTTYPATIPAPHRIIHQRLSPAWFAFLDGAPHFFDAKAP